MKKKPNFLAANRMLLKIVFDATLDLSSENEKRERKISYEKLVAAILLNFLRFFKTICVLI